MSQQHTHSSQEIDHLSHSYDTLPYTSHAFPQTHPDHLRAAANLFELMAPSIENARVLEIGCSFGGNLIPLAVQYPNAEFLGLDISAEQIRGGQAAIDALGLKNITLKQQDITTFEVQTGQFDYILCHGVYSWIPEQARAAILRVIGQGLSENGLGYVSYNTYPGWKAKEVWRDVMKFRSSAVEDIKDKINYGIGMLQFLEEFLPENNIWKKTISQDFEQIKNSSRSYLAHEYFEIFNEPCYFHDFMREAQSHGLCFVSESNINGMFLPPTSSEQAWQMIQRECGNDIVKLQQFADFLTNRTFRQSILARDSHRSQLRHQYNSTTYRSLEALHLQGEFSRQGATQPAQENENGAASNPQTMGWKSASNPNFVTNDGVLANFLVSQLNQAGRNTVAVTDLVAQAEAALSAHGIDKTHIMNAIHQLVTQSAVRIRTLPVQLDVADLQRPKLKPVYRKWHEYVNQHPDQITISTGWHEAIRPDVLLNILLPLLDGTRSQEDLANALLAAHRNGEIKFLDGNNQPYTDAKHIETLCHDFVKNSLNGLSKHGLLESAPTSQKTASSRAQSKAELDQMDLLKANDADKKPGKSSGKAASRNGSKAKK